MMETVAESKQKYSSSEVVTHYAGLDYITACERLLFERYIGIGSAVLDLGVGGGRTTPFLSSRASRYVGADYSAGMVAACRRKFPTLQFGEANGADLSCFADGDFDAVVLAFNSLDYLSEQERRACLRESHRVLKPGGMFIFSSHNPRAVVSLPVWNRARVRRLAEQTAPAKFMVTPLATLIGTAAAVRAAVRGVVTTVIRSARMFRTSAFWQGEGYVLDSAHGGLLTHFAVPEKVRAEVQSFGFRYLEALGDDFPRRSHLLTTGWYYYVFSRPEE